MKAPHATAQAPAVGFPPLALFDCLTPTDPQAGAAVGAQFFEFNGHASAELDADARLLDPAPELIEALRNLSHHTAARALLARLEGGRA